MKDTDNLIRGVKNPPAPTYNSDFYETAFMKWVLKITRKLLDRYDGKRDRKICGRALTKYVRSVDREGLGATGSKSTRYLYLDQVFGDTRLSPEWKVMDVGCGKGRVFAYLLNKGFTGEMYGVELNPQVAKFAESWTSKYSNVHVSCGNAFDVDYNEYDVLLLGRPFESEAFTRFAQKLEQELTHSVLVYYWGDQQSGDYLNRRPGWSLQHRDWIFRYKGIHLISAPQRYSVWTYSPRR